MVEFGIKVFTFAFIFLLCYYVGVALEFPEQWLAGTALFVSYLSSLIISVRNDCYQIKKDLLKVMKD